MAEDQLPRRISGFTCWCGSDYGVKMGCALHTPIDQLLPIIGLKEPERTRQIELYEQRHGKGSWYGIQSAPKETP